MKILVISGFLGAGKTTFIQELCKRTGREIAIFENELGAQNIDTNRLKQIEKPQGQEEKKDTDSKINLWEMTEGCICCSAKGDLALSVLTIANSVDPEYLVIEPTGVGLLSNILTNLNKIVYERISICSPITIIDGKAWQTSAREYPEIFLDQLKNGKTIILSKLETEYEKDRNAIAEIVAKENQQAEIVAVPYKEKPDSWWQGLLNEGYDGSPEETTETVQLPDTFSLSEASVDSLSQLVLLMDDLIHGKYGYIVRAKGCVKVGKEKLRFDIAGERYAITGAGDEELEQAVFIGNHIKRQELRIILLTASNAIRIVDSRERKKR